MTMTPLDIIEGKLHAHGQQPKRRGDNLTARCPAHDDHTPSLSVTVGRDRDIILHCHAGCDPGAIMAAIGLSWTDLSDRHKTETRRLEATYDYTNADGTLLLYQVLRYHPKDFRQRRIDPDTGDVVWNLNGVERVPYNLPTVVAASDVWIAEGEKDADALTAAGVTATCNSGGAGKFTAEHARWMAGKDITVVADDDPPGHAHARQVAELCLGAGAASVRVFKPAHGKDVAEHLGAGHTLDDLLPLDAADTAPHPLAPFLVDWPTFWAGDHNDVEWVLEPLFAAGRGHAIYAGAKTGKSYVVLAACAALATGRPFLRYPGGDPVDVLYVDYEMTEADLLDRLEEFGYTAADDLSRLHYALLPSIEGLDTPEGGAALVASAEAVGARLVIIDTTGRAVEGEENAADTVRAFYRHTGLGLKQRGIAFARLDHAGKDADKGQRGTSAKNDDVDIVVRMTNRQDGKRLTATHRRMSWYPEQTDIQITEGDDGVTRFSTAAVMWPDGTTDVAADLDALGVPLDCSTRDAEAALKAAGSGRRRKVVVAAIRWRSSQASDDLLPVDNSVDNRREPPREPPLGNHLREPPAKPALNGREPPREPPGTTLRPEAGTTRIPRRDAVGPGGAGTDADDLPENQPDYDPTEF